MKLDTQSAPSTPGNPSVKNRKRMNTKMRIMWSLIIVCAVLLLSFGGYLFLRPQVQPLQLPPVPAHLTMGDLGLSDWQAYQQADPKDPLHQPTLPATPQVTTELASLENAAGRALIAQKKLEQGLAYLKVAAQANPDNLRFANDYRIALRDNGRFQEEEKFFSQQLKKQTTINVQLDLALSYVDEMRSCPKPPDGLVCQAQFSSRSITTLDTILEKMPYNIVARYARGLNNLYWPTLMGHLPKAQTDLQYAVALSKPLNAIPNSFAPDAYTALGDVFAKDNKIDTAHNVWLNGKKEASNSSMLDNRLNIPRDQLVDQENNAIRGLGVYVDTNIVLFWQKER